MATENAIIAAARAQGLKQPMPYVGVVAVGAALTLTKAAHSGFMVNLDTLTGSVVTLPASTGSGATYKFVVSVVPTSNSHKVQVANATDVMRGVISVVATATGVVTAFGNVAASDTITLATNTGGVQVGETVEVTDVAAGFWAVRGAVVGGTPATPFSAAVS